MRGSGTSRTWLLAAVLVTTAWTMGVSAAFAQEAPALAAITELPVRHQQTPAMKTLAADAQRALSRLTRR